MAYNTFCLYIKSDKKIGFVFTKFVPNHLSAYHQQLYIQRWSKNFNSVNINSSHLSFRFHVFFFGFSNETLNTNSSGMVPRAYRKLHNAVTEPNFENDNFQSTKSIHWNTFYCPYHTPDRILADTFGCSL